MNEKRKFKVGDVVVLKTKFYEQTNPKITRNTFKPSGKETIIDASFIPPTMVVNNLLKEVDDFPRKVKCIWYSHNTGKFSEKDFLEDVIEKVDNESNNKQSISLQENGFVYLFMLMPLLLNFFSSKIKRWN
ncbi:MAG: hypothetical protein R3E32_24660 [Chitinophagales bacterium]